MTRAALPFAAALDALELLDLRRPLDLDAGRPLDAVEALGPVGALDAVRAIDAVRPIDAVGTFRAIVAIDTIRALDPVDRRTVGLLEAINQHRPQRLGVSDHGTLARVFLVRLLTRRPDIAIAAGLAVCVGRLRVAIASLADIDVVTARLAAVRVA